MNIYVGNLDYNTEEQDLEQLFGEFGEVSSVNIITDKFTGRSKGFGFVIMDDDTEAKSAIDGLDGRSVGRREIRVNEAKPRR